MPANVESTNRRGATTPSVKRVRVIFSFVSYYTKYRAFERSF